MSMIMPSRWYSGGKGLDEFRNNMLNNKHVAVLHDFFNPEQVFPNTNIRGGICYFLWNQKYDNEVSFTKVVTHQINAKPILMAVTSINLSKDKFDFIPLQDFTKTSDIDWSKSIPEIDQQLYTKYNLTAAEVAFIEGMIKPMS